MMMIKVTISIKNSGETDAPAGTALHTEIETDDAAQTVRDVLAVGEEAFDGRFADTAFRERECSDIAVARSEFESEGKKRKLSPHLNPLPPKRARPPKDMRGN